MESRILQVAPPFSKKSLQTFVWVTIGFTAFVIVWGALVRATGSGAGCGSHWPLCNGEVIPRSPELKTLIEYFHRATSGMSLILVLAAGVWTFRVFEAGSFARRAASIASVSILLEALIGAGLVLLELVSHNQSVKRTLSIAMHFSNTLVLLASLVLLAVSAARGGGGWSWQRFTFRKSAAVFLGLFFVLGMAGAITALGDTLFPSESLLQGMKADFSGASHFLVQLRGMHPVIAMVLVLPWLKWVIEVMMKVPTNGTHSDDPVLKRWGRLLVVAVLANVVLGWVNLGLLAPVWTQLLHLSMAISIWVLFILFLDRAALKFQSQS